MNSNPIKNKIFFLANYISRSEEIEDILEEESCSVGKEIWDQKKHGVFAGASQSLYPRGFTPKG